MMKLKPIDKMMLTILYGISLIFMTMLIFNGSSSDVFNRIITYSFYVASVLSVMKGLSDIIISKQVKDLVFLMLVSTPLIIFLLYLVLFVASSGFFPGGYHVF